MSDDTYLHIAKAAGRTVWKKGFLWKGGGLCHGVSGILLLSNFFEVIFFSTSYHYFSFSKGNAYCFVALYRATKSIKYLHRALQFVLGYLDPVYREKLRVPDHPESLFEVLSFSLPLDNWFDSSLRREIQGWFA